MAKFNIEMNLDIDFMKQDHDQKYKDMEQDQDKKHDELAKLLKNQGSWHHNKQGSNSISPRSSSPPPPPLFLYNIEIKSHPKEFDPIEGEQREIVL